MTGNELEAVRLRNGAPSQEAMAEMKLVLQSLRQGIDNQEM